MTHRLTTANRAFAVGCVLFVVISGLTVPVASTSCPGPSRTAVERLDDGWMVFWSTSGCHSFVTTLDDEWSERGERDAYMSLPDNSTLYPTDVELAADGGWWVLSERGRLHRANASWGYQGPVANFSVPGDRFAYTYGLERDGAGRWWVDTEQGVFVYGPEGGRPIYSLDEGATDLVVEGSTVTLLEDGKKGGLVVSYSIPDDWSPRKDDPLHRDATHELGPEVFHPRHLTRSGDGHWVVVSGPGNRFTYTDDWAYTGRGPGQHATPSLLAGLFWLFPFLLVGWGAGALIVIAALLDRAPPAVGVLGVLLPTTTTVLALAIRQSALPPGVLAVYRVPDDTVAFALVSLVAVAASAGFFGGDDGDYWHPAWLAVLLALSLLPLAAVAFDFLTSASVPP